MRTRTVQVSSAPWSFITTALPARGAGSALPLASRLKSGDDERQIQTTTLADELGLSRDHDIYTIFRDHRSGLEYIRSNQELWEQGLYLELDAYQYHVFLDFREVQDDPFLPYSQLCSYLNGRGVPDIEEAIKEILLQPIHVPFRELTNAGQLRWLIDNRLVDGIPLVVDPEALAEVEEKALDLLDRDQGDDDWQRRCR